MEVSIAYNLMIRCVICIGIDICFVAGQLCTLYGEGCGIKYMKGTSFDCLCCCINCFLSSLCYIGSQFAQLNRSSLKSSGPVSIDWSSFCYTVDPSSLWKIQGRCSGKHLRCFRYRIRSVHQQSRMRSELPWSLHAG